MRILLTNDDGIYAPGIVSLAKALSKEHQIIVAAPNCEKSGFSHALTLSKPLKYAEVDYPNGIEAYSVDGMPADCVKFALLHIGKHYKPDLLISGINSGCNLGSDIMYSGTVSAAVDGAYMGIKSVAISRGEYGRRHSDEHMDEVAAFMADNIQAIYEYHLPKYTILNINYPVAEPAGIAFTSMGVNIYDDGYYEDEKVAGHFWLRGKSVSFDPMPDTVDMLWSQKGYVTITPIKLDRTDYDVLKNLPTAGFKLKI